MKWLPVIFFIALYSPLTYGRVWHVGGGSRFSQPTDAVSASLPGDTVVIHPGIYECGPIEITHALTLWGLGNPVLDGAGKHQIVTIAADHCAIRGITFRHSGRSSLRDMAAIGCINASHITIEDNLILDAHFGIHLSNCNHFVVRNNVIRGTPGDEQNTGNGIHLWKCSHAAIEDNQIEGHRDGIYFEFVVNAHVCGNISTRNIRYGLHFMFSNEDEYYENTFAGNGAGVAVMFSNHIAMQGNRFEWNRGASAYGLLLKEISDGTIQDNFFSENSVGIFMEGSNRLMLQRNHFTSNGYALRVQASCYGNHIEQNNFIANTFDVATNGSLMLNTVRANYWDKYEGYDLKHDGTGDVPYYPVSMYSLITEQNQAALMFMRSFMVLLLDRTERMLPSITPQDMKDMEPSMKRIA